MNTVTATIVRQSENSTFWFVKWPHRPNKMQKSYYATTYPGSDLIYIETSAKGKHVSGLVASRLMPVIKSAIERAMAIA